MHASWATRLNVAFAEVQKTLARAANTLAKRARYQGAREYDPSRGEASDPVLALLDNAPIDNEPVTDDDRLQIAKGWEAYRTGRLALDGEATHACLEANQGKNVPVEVQTNRA